VTCSAELNTPLSVLITFEKYVLVVYSLYISKYIKFLHLSNYTSNDYKSNNKHFLSNYYSTDQDISNEPKYVKIGPLEPEICGGNEIAIK
jgi:hypothetical protein